MSVYTCLSINLCGLASAPRGSALAGGARGVRAIRATTTQAVLSKRSALTSAGAPPAASRTGVRTPTRVSRGSPNYTYPACTDENCGGHAAPDGTHHQQGRCVVCSPSFNNLNREFMVRLWCDRPRRPGLREGICNSRAEESEDPGEGLASTVVLSCRHWHFAVPLIGVCHCLRPTSKRPIPPAPRAAKCGGRTVVTDPSCTPPRT